MVIYSLAKVVTFLLFSQFLNKILTSILVLTL